MTTERRTQAERTEATRARLVAAAIDCLIERGWAATTAVEVCSRAGVTRGALMHHYPSLSALLADALAALYSELSAPRNPVDSLVALVDNLWARVSMPEFKAVIEAWLAATNDPDLRAGLQPVIADFAKLIRPEELPIRDLLADPDAAAFFQLARESMLGLALGRATSWSGHALAHEDVVLDQLRARAAEIEQRIGNA